MYSEIVKANLIRNMIKICCFYIKIRITQKSRQFSLQQKASDLNKEFQFKILIFCKIIKRNYKKDNNKYQNLLLVKFLIIWLKIMR